MYTRTKTKKSKKLLCLILSIAILFSMMPAVTLTAEASEGGTTITYTSNDETKLARLFNENKIAWGINPTSWLPEKQEGVYTYQAPVYDSTGGRYTKDFGNGSGYSIYITDITDLESISFTYGDNVHHVTVEEAKKEIAERSYYYFERGYAPGKANPGMFMSSYSGGLRIIFNYFDVAEDVTISFNYKTDEELGVPVSVSDESLAESTGWTYGTKAGEYLVYATPKAGYYVDHWEQSFDNGTTYFEIAGSEKASYLAVSPVGGETNYRAVMAPYSWADAKLSISALNKNEVSFKATLAATARKTYTISETTMNGKCEMSLAGAIAYGDSLKISIASILPAEVQAYIVTIAGETTVLTADGTSVTGESVSFSPSANYLTISRLVNSLAQNTTADAGIDVKLVYDDPDATYTVSTVSNNEEYGTANKAYPADGQYLISATPADGYAISHWEAAKGADATSGFAKVEGSDGQMSMLVDVSENMTYRAVFVLATEKAVDILNKDAGINKMVYVNEPQGLMWNNYPGGTAAAPYIPMVGSDESFFTREGSIIGSADLSRITYQAASVEAGSGAGIWFTFKYYSDLNDVTVKLYKGDSTSSANLLYTLNAEILKMGTEATAGNGLCYLPACGMPYTDNVTVVFTANGKTTTKTLPLKEAMTESSLETGRLEATEEILSLYDKLVSELADKSVTYEYSSQYLMLKEELEYGLDDVVSAKDAGSLAKAKAHAILYLNDTATGIYHHGVDAGITVKDTMQVVRVPEISCIFDAMCAALEQAYPDGHWYYSVGGSKFGIYFNGAGYLADNTDRPGVRMDGGVVSGGYGVSDYQGDRNTGMANGVSNQCVWEGICTGTPNSFSSAGSPDTKIILNRGNRNDLTWDLGCLLQHYSADELLANEVYAKAYANQKGDEDGQLDKTLRIEYVDFFLCNETEATRNVVTLIGDLDEHSSEEALDEAQDAYKALTNSEKAGVFNYEDLLVLTKEGDELKAALIDAEIIAIGEVEYTEESYAKISDVRASYEDAADSVKPLVENLELLEEAENTFATLSAAKISEVNEIINELPEEITYPDSTEAVKAAKEAWDLLVQADKDSEAQAEIKARLERAVEAYEKAKAAYYSEKLDGSLEKVLSYILKTVSDPQVGSVGGEWAVLAQARGGLENEEYYENYYDTVVDYVKAIGSGKLDERKSTDNSRVILALSAIGKDARNVGGYDLVSPYSDLEWVTNQGINGAIFALLALDSGNYDIVEQSSGNSCDIRQQLIDCILGNEVSGGGFSLTGEEADVDITAMALQALAPYVDKDEVSKAVDRAVDKLSELQDENGGFSYIAGGDVNVESTSQVVIALLTLGINPVEDSRFVKGGNNPFTAILPYQLEDGSFEHILGKGSDLMATEQSAMALVAYERFLSGDTPLYQMASKEVVNTTDPYVDKNDEKGEKQTTGVQEKTGDENNITIYLILCGAMIAAGATIGIRRKEECDGPDKAA